MGTFGGACLIFPRVTLLGVKHEDGRVTWAPDASFKFQGSDGLMLIKCTPFALAMGLTTEGSLAESAMNPGAASPPRPRYLQRSEDIRRMNEEVKRNDEMARMRPEVQLRSSTSCIPRRCCG